MQRLLHRAAGTAALSSLLAACAGGTNLPIDSVNSHSTLLARQVLRAVRPDRSASWMQPRASASDLLYVSDAGTNDVYVYTYPAGNLAGTLTGFHEPQGLCGDGKGDVWVADTQRSRLVEYAHGSKGPIATLSDAGQYPSGCAVDAHGTLAVTNLVTTRGGAGSVALYAGAAGKPKIVTSPSLQELYFAGFDSAGNLFVDGWPPNFAQAALGEIKHGTDTLVPVPIKGATIEYPGGVQLRGTTLDVGDQIDDAVFQIDEDGTVVGVTPLDGAGDCVQGTILRKTFVCPDSANSDVELFGYPAGGTPKRILRGFSLPTGTAISR